MAAVPCLFGEDLGPSCEGMQPHVIRPSHGRAGDNVVDVTTVVDPSCAFTATALEYTLGLSAGTLGCFPNALQTHHLLVVPVQASGNQASLRTKLVTRLSSCADTGIVSNGDRTDGADVDSTYGRVANKKSSMFKASLVGSPKANVISCSKQTFAFEATVCFRTHLSRHQPHRGVRRIPCNPLVL